MLVNQNHVGLEVGGKCDGLRLAGVDVQQQAFGGNGCPEAKRSIHRLPMAAAMAARAWGMGGLSVPPLRQWVSKVRGIEV